jgi:hypothetical protein
MSHHLKQHRPPVEHEATISQHTGCAHIPAVTPTKPYHNLGQFIQISADMKAYLTKGNVDIHDRKELHKSGDEQDLGIILFYDVYGFHPNTLQFSDLLATALNNVHEADNSSGSDRQTHHPKSTTWILIPDFMRGELYEGLGIMAKPTKLTLAQHMEKVAGWGLMKERIGMSVGWLRKEKNIKHIGMMGECS